MSLARPYRVYSGRIAYIGDGDGAGPVERGREWFTVSVYDDGNRTIAARCEIDDAVVVRDVTYSVDARWRPVDAFIRLNVHGRFMGSGWFRFTDTFAECETFMAGGGRVSQRIDCGSGEEGHGAVSFGAHPVACDVWHLGVHEPSATALGSPVKHRAFMSSLLPNGASGPMLSAWNFGVEYLGDERLTVAAGTFDTHHFRYLLDGHPDEHVWYTTADRILVRIRWDLLRTTYELAELTYR